ncbi:hypothetical protein BKA70DRAFT_1257517 [Coprinopsis sp. MPI-PUGE-AT-0042]|nr:hypothetical protein BKA70DRAFT_1257517 [Coprinopsis sp. MPI-PUGE-AT-0042]
MSQPVIIYLYEASPYAQKVNNALTLKNVPHQRVLVSPVLPRPELSEILGIPYRRIPLLAIGNDVYCDTTLITAILERRFPSSEGFGTLFPPRKNSGTTDTGLIKAFSKFYIDGALFPTAALLLPWEKLPPAFVADRSDFRGAPLNVEALVANRDKTIATLSAHLVLVEEQLTDGRTWLFDTEAPSLADVSIHFVLAWSKAFPAAQPLWKDNKFPLTEQWVGRFNEYLKEHQKQAEVIKGDEAGKLVFGSSHESYDIVGFDEIEAEHLRLKLHDTVSIAPDDTGRNHPTSGKLVALSKEEVIIEIAAPSGTVRCHFPRLGYVITASQTANL